MKNHSKPGWSHRCGQALLNAQQAWVPIYPLQGRSPFTLTALHSTIVPDGERDVITGAGQILAPWVQLPPIGETSPNPPGR